MADAETLRGVVDQIGTMVLSHSGEVLASSGELQGNAGVLAAKAILSMLRDAGNVLDTERKETLERLVVNFPTYDYIVTHDSAHVYVVQRVKAGHPQ